MIVPFESFDFLNFVCWIVGLLLNFCLMLWSCIDDIGKCWLLVNLWSLFNVDVVNCDLVLDYLYCIVKFWNLEVGTSKSGLGAQAFSKQDNNWTQHQHHWWHGRASASAPGKTVARACPQARAARAISLQALCQDRSKTGPVQGFPGPIRSWTGLRPVRSSVHVHPLFGPRSRPVRSGPVRSWTDLHP